MFSHLEFVAVLACLSLGSTARRVSTSSRPTHSKLSEEIRGLPPGLGMSSDDSNKKAFGALAAFLLANPVARVQPQTVKPLDVRPQTLKPLDVMPQTVSPLDSIFAPSSKNRVVSSEPWINRLLDDSIQVKIPPREATSWILDPYADEKAKEEQQKVTQYKLNLGYAIDHLNTDIPKILREQPNWDIYTEGLELEFQGADPVAFRLLSGVAGLATPKVKGLLANQKALNRLQKFRDRWVQQDNIRIKTRASMLSLQNSENGDDVVEVRWNAHLLMKPDIELIPRWAAKSIKFFQNVVGSPDVGSSPREFIIDGVSRFFFDSEGKVYRHVITDLDLLPRINMLEVDDILWMIGVPRQSPAFAFTNIDER